MFNNATNRTLQLRSEHCEGVQGLNGIDDVWKADITKGLGGAGCVCVCVWRRDTQSIKHTDLNEVDIGITKHESRLACAQNRAKLRGIQSPNSLESADFQLPDFGEV